MVHLGKIFTDIYKPYSVEVFYGPMWSKKTLNVIIIADNLRRMGIKYQVFKPRIDTRYFEDKIVSRFEDFGDDKPLKDKDKFLTLPCEIFDETNPEEIIKYTKPSTKAIIISEAELADDNIANVAQYLRKTGRYLVVEGLNLDYTGEYFSKGIANIISTATHPHSLYSFCNFKLANGERCREPAHFTQKLNQDGSAFSYLIDRAKRIEIGDYCYEPRCINHHEVPGAPGLEKIF